MKRQNISMLLLLLGLSSLLPAQSNETIDRFLDSDKADLGTTVLFIYQASGALDHEATAQEAMDHLLAASIGKRFRDHRADSPIKFKEYAHIVMDELDLPGGLMYSITKLPRYAARELTSRRWMPGKLHPGAELTPWEVMTSLAEILAWLEENQ